MDYVNLADVRTDAGFAISLTHRSGVKSRAVAGKLNHNIEKSWRAYGSAGSYIASGTDVQTQAMLGGRRPTAEDVQWGIEEPSR